MAGGGARWASLLELSGAGWLNGRGWPLGRRTFAGPRVYLPEKAQRENVLALAPPGSGKTRGILVPALLSETQQPPERRRSLIIVDPVGELHTLTGDALRQSHRVLVWNPGGRSNCQFDPLAYLPPPTDADFVNACETAALIWLAATQPRSSSDPYWDQQPANVLKAILMHEASEIPGLVLSELMDFLMQVSSAELQAALAQSGRTAVKYRAQVIADLLKNEKADSGVFGSLRERFMVLVNPTIEATMGRPSVSFQKLVAEPTALYVQIGTNAAHFHPLLSVFVSTAIAQLISMTGEGRALPREIRFIIDELGNLGRIHDLVGGLATLRKYGIGFLMATQTLARLTERYGPDGLNAILGCCGTVLALGGLYYDDAEWVSRQLGTYERTRANASINQWC